MEGSEAVKGYAVRHSKQCQWKRLGKKVGLVWVETWVLEVVLFDERSVRRSGESRVGIGWLCVGVAEIDSSWKDRAAVF